MCNSIGIIKFQKLIVWKENEKQKGREKMQQVALPQHGFGLIDVIEYGVKHLKPKVSKVQ